MAERRKPGPKPGARKGSLRWRIENMPTGGELLLWDTEKRAMERAVGAAVDKSPHLTAGEIVTERWTAVKGPFHAVRPMIVVRRVPT